MRLLSTALLAVFVVHAGYSDTDVVQIPERAIVGQVVTFDLPIEGVAGNPYDAAEMTLDVEFTTPDGEVIRVPGFYEEQYDVTIGWPEMIVDRLGFGPFKIGPGQRQNPYVLVDNVRLVEEKTGDEVILDDFESGSTWYEHGIILEVVDGGVDEGKCLKFTLSKDSPEKYPVAFRRLDDTDWTRYRALRFSLKLEEPLPPDDFDFVLYRKHNQRYNTHSIHFPGLKVGEWNEIEIPLEPRTETAEVSWAGSDGWRVRYMPAVPGRYTAKAIYKADTYREELPFRFRVENGEYGGFVRVSENDHRYLVRDDGSPVMLNGFNVLSSNVGYYKTYLDKMHEAGCNFIRIWMSPNTFGFERKLNQYDQRRSAQMDTLVEMCNQLGVYIMPSLIDFRSLQADASWRWAPWNVDNDGYLESPDDFFTHPQTMPAMRNLMRYFVARWGAYPSVLCWEYFNEVNNVDTWGQGEFIDPAVVRTWNQQMSELAREIDPYGRLLTTSFAELEDDEIWEQPGMDLVQRHFYLKPGTPFVDFSLKAYEVLARHNKPVLTGEFGRSQNTFAAETKDGITLHNGIWSAALSGAAGTGMDWWWRWIDDYDLYFHFEYLNRFLEGIQWDQEDFKMERVKVTAKGEVFNTPILFAPQSSAYFFSPHLHHRPNTVVLDAEGFPDVYEHIPQRLFGEEDENYNPVTFQTIYQSDG
ncbi:MAG: cellulase family glycosylhydrolase, partial [Verrucomicrobiota bacterium]